MSRNPNYQIFPLDLTIAGSQDIAGLFTYIRVVDAYLTASGTQNLDAKVSVVPRRTGGDGIPMRLNGKVQLSEGTDFIRVSWAAQPGTTLVLFVSDQDNDSGIDVESPPTKQLVTSSVGAQLVASSVTVNAVAVQLAAALSSRQSVTIQNLGAADIYVNGSNAVAVGNGIKVAANGGVYVVDKNTGPLWAISAAAGNDVRVAVES